MGVFNSIMVNFLRIQLNLTQYQVMALISIIIGKKSPVEISDDSNIPRPKVYETLEALEKMHLIVKNEDNLYAINKSKLQGIREDTSQLTKEYQDFVNYLFENMHGSDLLKDIRIGIMEILHGLGFRIDQKEKIVQNLKGNTERPIEELYDRYLLMMERRFRARPTYDFQMALNRREVIYPEMICESPTAGIRTAVYILPDKDLITGYVNGLIFSNILQYNVIMLISPNAINNSEKELMYVDKPSKLELHILSYDLKEIESIFSNLDIKWSILKNKLVELDEEREKIKTLNRNLIYKTNLISKYVAMVPVFSDIYRDILTRIKNDLESEEQLLIQVDDFVKDHFLLFDDKILFPENDLVNFEKNLVNIRDKLLEKNTEIQNFEEELLSIPDENNPYNKFGFRLNPFSLWVPIEKPSIIVNQEQAKIKIKKFIHETSKGSDSNLFFITGEKGVGKSHFLHYYSHMINQSSRSLAIKIQCKYNRDIVDLYPQITEGLKSLLISKKQSTLADNISNIITSQGTPRLIQDLMLLLRELTHYLKDNGYEFLFLFIDELENSLPPSRTEFNRISYNHRARVGIPQSIVQLSSLSKLAGLGIVVTFRIEDWLVWGKEIKERVSKFDPDHIIRLDALNLEDSKQFLMHRLEDTNFKDNSLQIKKSISFEHIVIEYIWKVSHGNPRKMLRTTGMIFRKAILKGITHIDGRLVLDST